MTGLADVRLALDRWAAAAKVATFWWRDDDAGRSMPALDRLLSLSAQLNVPIGLAVIPTTLDDAAVRRITTEKRATPLLHGFAHRNHAQGKEKKSEFPPSRPLEAMLGDLREGLRLLQGAFGERMLPVLVPPWNRIAPALVPSLASLGLKGLSRYLARDAEMAAPDVREVNCHVDLIDWQGTRGFIGKAASSNLLIANLEARFGNDTRSRDPIGILSHHQVHDEDTWAFLEALFGLLTNHEAARVAAPVELFPEAGRGR